MSDGRESSAVDVSKITQMTSKPVVNTNVGGGSGGYRIRRLRCCTRDGGWLALRSLPAGGGFKAPCAAAVTAVRGERHGKGALSACQLGTGKMVGNICRGRVERCKVTSEPGPPVCPGKSLGDTRLLPRRRPAYRQHEPGPGSRMERVKVTPRSDTYGWREGGPRAAESVRGRVPVAGQAGGPSRSSWEARYCGWSPGDGPSWLMNAVNPRGMSRVSEPRLQGKSYDIPKMLVWDAWLKIKENGGAAGPDGVTIEQFEGNLTGNLYKLWNRMSSGSYFPGPVRMVEIPKPGGTRILGIPNVADRVAQAVAVMVLEPVVDPLFHDDSYAYRPGRGPLDAVAVCRERCFKNDWGAPG